ncbi:MAG: GntR family transcriptional regulator [Planctomycetota bacterium]|nr:GntR family transcriptional regulator [Planctomycetota bacterium]
MRKAPNSLPESEVKHLWLKQHLLERIRSGVWKPGAKVPTQRQLMAEYRLSHATVSRALQDLAREGYIARAVRTGSRVLGRAAPAALRLRLHLLGGVPPAAAKGLSVFRDLLDEARALGMTVEVHEGLSQVARAKVLDGLLERRVSDAQAREGVVFPYFAGNRTHIDRLREAGAAYAVLDVPHEMPGYAVVLRDHRAAARALVERLLRAGHARGRIGLVLGRRDEADPDPFQWDHAKAEGAFDALGGAPESQIVRDVEPTFEAGVRAGEALLARAPSLTAVYCDNDHKAAGVCQAAAARGLSVPADLSLAFINRPAEDLVFPVAPSYAWASPDGVGAAAARMLFDELTDPGAKPAGRVLPMVFEEGSSIAAPRKGGSV